MFDVYFVADFLYARYTLSVSRLESARAVTTGALMYVLLAIGILNFTHNPLYLPPRLGLMARHLFCGRARKKEMMETHQCFWCDVAV